MMGKNKKYIYDTELDFGDTNIPSGIIRNRKTEQYGCVIHKSELNEIRTWYQFKDTDFYFDLKWMPKYMIEEVVEELLPYFD